MDISISLSFLIFIIIAIIIVTSTTTYFIVRQKRQKKKRGQNNTPNIIQVYREKETVLRTWYSVIAGLDTTMLLLSIFSNAAGIILAQFDIKQEIIISCMIVSLVSTSIRDGFNLPNLRKPYIKATRHLELEIDNCEYTHSKEEKQQEEDLHKAYSEAQNIIETYFE